MNPFSAVAYARFGNTSLVGLTTATAYRTVRVSPAARTPGTWTINDCPFSVIESAPLRLVATNLVPAGSSSKIQRSEIDDVPVFSRTRTYGTDSPTPASRTSDDFRSTSWVVSSPTTRAGAETAAVALALRLVNVARFRTSRVSRAPGRTRTSNVMLPESPGARSPRLHVATGPSTVAAGVADTNSSAGTIVSPITTFRAVVEVDPFTYWMV